LAGRLTQLRPIHPDDYEFLYQIAIAPENGFRWRYRGAIPDRAEFVKGLTRGALVQFVVERMATSESVGLVTAYNANMRDGWAYIASICSPRFRSSGAVVDGLVTLSDYVFQNWPLRKLYFEALEFNYEQFGSVAGRLAHEEGRLREHVFYDGRYWDVVTAAIYGREWATRAILLPRAGDVQVEVSSRPQLDLDEFCSVLVEEMELDTEAVSADARLVEDLHFDSLRMVELGALIADIGGPTSFEMLGEVFTVRDAFQWLCIASSMPRIDESNIV
jgi:RimJ/RimL family protein N-acetyltransferase